MSSHAPAPAPAVPNHSSTPITASVALGRPNAPPTATLSPAPTPVPPRRNDIHDVRKLLHDALGEAGLPYWKTLNAYLVGQVGRDELQCLVREWLKGKDLQLHNDFLTLLLHNAASPQMDGPLSPLNMHKRGQGGLDAPDFDTDAVYIAPKERVRHWVMGMGGRERDRVRRAAANEDDEPDADGDGEAAGNSEWETVVGRKRKWSVFQSNPQHPPLAQGSHYIPSSHQLALRLSQVAKPYGLDVSQDSLREVGEFMGVGLNAHLGDVLHSVAHLTGRDRPGEDTMRVPLGVKNPNIPSSEDHPLPPPSLQTMQYLFNMAPGLQPQASPTLYKLASGLTVAEVENTTPPDKISPSRRPSAAVPSIAPPAPVSPAKAASTIHAAAGQGKIDMVSQTLAETGLLKLDKAGRGEGEEPDRKKEKKHNLHWKYEDPAIILKDLLG